MSEIALHLTELGPYAGQLAAIVVCLFVLGFSSMSEAVLMRTELARARQLADSGRRGARQLVGLLEHRQQVYSSLILLINLAIIVVSTYTTEVTIGLSGGERRWLPVTSVGMIVSILVFFEVAPKTYALRRVEAVGLVAAPLITTVHRMVHPVGRVLHMIGIWVNRKVLVPVIGGETIDRWPRYTDKEISEVVAEGEANGDIEEEEREMIAGVIEFADKVTREVMTPRTDMVCVPADTSLVAAARVSEESGYSRLPVYQGNVDSIIGIVYAKDMVSALQTDGPDLTAAQIARKPPPVVPESKKAAEVLQLMQRGRLHMAIVIDEYGGTAGVVTIEDLLEEIFGEIMDEYDAEGEPIRVLEEATILVDGRVSVDEIEDELKVALPEGEFDSVGGFILDQLGRFPVTGEKVLWEDPETRVRLEFTVEQVSGNRVRRVRVVRHPGAGASAETNLGDEDRRDEEGRARPTRRPPA